MNVPQTRHDFGDLFIRALNPEELGRVLRLLDSEAIAKSEDICNKQRVQAAIIRALTLQHAPDNTIPSWLRLLDECLLELRQRSTPYRSHLGVLKNLTVPVANYFTEKLIGAERGRIDRLLASPAWRSLRTSLCLRLAWTSRFAADRDWALFCSTRANQASRGRFASRTTIAKAYFKDGVELRTIALLEANAALARLWAIQGELWCRRTAEFLGHMEGLASKLSGADRCLPVTMLATDKSDWHRGNRAVIHIRLKDRTEWYYKPRSGTAEMFWASVLGLCGPLTGRRFHLARLIKGKGHFWMQAVSHKPCQSLGEVAEFYFKAGIILSLLYRLRGVDFHADNVIAHRDNPVLIDCETLLHPPVDPLLRTIRGIGFLPAWDRDNVAGADSLSALGRRHSGPHAVLMKQQRCHARDFCDSIVAGFTIFAPTGLRDPLPSSALTKIIQETGFRKCRLLFRSTGEYHSILDLSLQPSVLSNARLRRDYLWRLCKQTGTFSRVSRAEVVALERADIPIFYGPPARVRRVTQQQLKRQTETLLKGCQALSVAAPP